MTPEGRIVDPEPAFILMAADHPNLRYDELGQSEAAQLVGAGRGIATCAPRIDPLPGAVVGPLADQTICCLGAFGNDAAPSRGMS